MENFRQNTKLEYDSDCQITFTLIKQSQDKPSNNKDEDRPLKLRPFKSLFINSLSKNQTSLKKSIANNDITSLNNLRNEEMFNFIKTAKPPVEELCQSILEKNSNIKNQSPPKKKFKLLQRNKDHLTISSEDYLHQVQHQEGLSVMEEIQWKGTEETHSTTGEMIPVLTAINFLKKI